MLTVEYRPLDKLIPYARNARTHSPEQVAQIAASIKEFGFNNPILVDGENGVIAGHGRLLAAQKLGLDKVPCIELAHLSETQKRAYILADNKLAENADWDDAFLALELKDLSLDIDIKDLGFNVDEINRLLPDEVGGGEMPELSDLDRPQVKSLTLKYEDPEEYEELLNAFDRIRDIVSDPNLTNSECVLEICRRVSM